VTDEDGVLAGSRLNALQPINKLGLLSTLHRDTQADIETDRQTDRQTESRR